MNVTAIIVTRGQEVSLDPILESLPAEWEVVAWLNGVCVWRWAPNVARWRSNTGQHLGYAPDLSVYGRYAAIEHASNNLIYVQDDDVIVSDPQAIVDALWEAPCSACGGSGRQLDEMPTAEELERDPQADPPSCSSCKTWGTAYAAGELVANMPQEFRHEGYTDSCLVGFGAAFHRDAPKRAFDQFNAAKVRVDMTPADKPQEFFYRTCDVVFTTLTPRVLVDVPKADREFASDPDRMWRQPSHFGERTRMLDLARRVRDA